MLSDEQIASIRRSAMACSREVMALSPAEVLALLSAHDDAVRFREAADAVVTDWDDDEIGQIDGELIDALRPAGQGGGEDGDWNEGVRLSGKAD